MPNCPTCHAPAVAIQAAGVQMHVCRVHGPIADALPVPAATKEAGPPGPVGPQGPAGPPGEPAPPPAAWVLDFERNADGFTSRVTARPLPAP